MDRECDNWKPFEALSGCEFDAAFHNPDPAIINQADQPEKWNRMTIREGGNRLEYWITL